MADKLPLCCSKLQSKLTHDENNLRTLAQRASYAYSKNRDITKLKAMIADAKVAIAADKALITDHEAEHAGQSAVA